MNENKLLKVKSHLKWCNASQYMPPYFCPKDLESIFDVRCKLKENKDTDSFDENFKGFTLILAFAVVEMLDAEQFHSSYR